ncbi:hypothetical protein [Halobaculum marinum]|uniref:DUF7982 domain-containing protein n=1 Tax=Halobaculum marinum TaxID=3031996 RepID=A0ABD5WVT6_9EURY|nr:hypothetical protein [Halobaculum sp. DT55]
MSEPEVAAGGRLRDRIGTRAPTAVFTGLGVLLVAAGFAVPELRGLLVAWGGTALFLALLFRFVFTEPTVSAAVTTEVYTTLARNTRRRTPTGEHRYLPDEDDGVSLAVDGETFDPIGERLLATVDTDAGEGALSERLSVLVDVVVNELELAGHVSATTADEEVVVTVVGSRVGTEELFDHPVVSLVGVALVRHLDTPITVDASVEDGVLVVTYRWS